MANNWWPNSPKIQQRGVVIIPHVVVLSGSQILSQNGMPNVSASRSSLAGQYNLNLNTQRRAQGQMPYTEFLGCYTQMASPNATGSSVTNYRWQMTSQSVGQNGQTDIISFVGVSGTASSISDAPNGFNTHLTCSILVIVGNARP